MCYSKKLFYFGFNFASTELKLETEELVYPFGSFISEMGGSLGLFVGFSFLALWYYIEYIILKCKMIKNNYVGINNE